MLGFKSKDQPSDTSIVAPTAKVNSSKTTITMPKDLIEKARAKLAERDLDLETYLAVYLRMIIRAPKGILGLEDDLPFGKYNGEKVEHIARIDPNYINWLITQDGRTKFQPEVLILVNEMFSKD